MQLFLGRWTSENPSLAMVKGGDMTSSENAVLFVSALVTSVMSIYRVLQVLAMGRKWW